MLDGHRVQGKKKKKNEKSFLTGCDEQYVEPSTEDWIQCVKCQRWWHEQSSSFEGDLTFLCDICLLLGDALSICNNLVLFVIFQGVNISM
jgi:hypothetical protein